MIKVKSINISSLKTMSYQGKTFPTGIFKKSVSRPVKVSKEGLVGDRQGDLKNHGGKDKAVYAFSEEHYLYWRKELGDSGLSAGSFGENLTLSVFNESEVNIGDQFLVGGCLLEVSQPRVPCFKLGVAVGNRKMPRLFTKKGETGAYFRVIEEGVVAIGDTVEKVNTLDLSITVKDLFRSIFDKSFENPISTIEKAMTISELSNEWKSILEDKLSGKL